MMGKKQEREKKFLIGIPDTGRDQLQDADVQWRETQLFHCMTPRLNQQARGVVMSKRRIKMECKEIGCVEENGFIHPS